jgi:hypothetical protein
MPAKPTLYDTAEYFQRQADGYARGCGLDGECGGRGAARADHRDPTGDQLGGERRQAVDRPPLAPKVCVCPKTADAPVA